MKNDFHEIAAVKAAEVPYESTATYSACLTMENDSRICAKIDNLRRIDGTITPQDIEKVFLSERVEIDSWAVGKVDFVKLAKNFNDDREPVPVEDAVLDSLKSASISDDKVRLTSQLERNDYVKVDAILKALGGKWVTKERAHVFESADPEEAIADFLLTGKLDKPEKFGFFPTPEPLARYLVSLAGLTPLSTVLEPSAGIGNLAKLCAEVVGFEKVTCFEIQQKNCDALTNLGFSVQRCDFMSVTPKAEFSHVCMNPPFERQQDIDHVLKAYEFLKPGGTLVAIMSASVRFRSNKKTVQFREFLEQHNAYVVDNPADAFKQSGTMVNTISIMIVKPVEPISIPESEILDVAVEKQSVQVKVLAETCGAQIGFDF